MKLKKVAYKDGEFRPFEITIVVDNEDDLRNLWHRFNVSDLSNVYHVESQSLDAPEVWETEGDNEIWMVLDDKANEFGMKKEGIRNL